jgi:4-carboxymuconolactone decarboxylase
VSRLPYLKRDDLDEEGSALWDSIMESRGAGLVNDDGDLVGPFNAFVHAPRVGARLSELGATLRFQMSIDRRLIELAIITVGAYWKAEFEWWAHARMARQHGVPDAVVEAIGNGEVPPLESEDDRAVYNLAHQLVRQGRLDPATYSAAQERLGDRGLVELVALCGYYTLVSYTLNAFEVPLPAGVPRTWPD